MTRRVTVYRTRRQRELYLYVDADDDLTRVPEKLLQRFGVPIEALALDLSPDRKLARADAAVVLASIAESGYYLQLPPKLEALDP